MAADGVEFVGMRSARWEETAELFREVIGANVSRRTADMVGFELMDGTILELDGPGDDFHPFLSTGPVVVFRVGDFDESRARMLAANADLIGDPQHRDGISWQLFHCPDGIAEIIGPGSPSRPRLVTWPGQFTKRSARQLRLRGVRLCSRCPIIAGVHRESVLRR